MDNDHNPSVVHAINARGIQFKLGVFMCGCVCPVRMREWFKEPCDQLGDLTTIPIGHKAEELGGCYRGLTKESCRI